MHDHHYVGEWGRQRSLQRFASLIQIQAQRDIPAFQNIVCDERAAEDAIQLVRAGRSADAAMTP